MLVRAKPKGYKNQKGRANQKGRTKPKREEQNKKAITGNIEEGGCIDTKRLEEKEKKRKKNR